MNDFVRFLAALAADLIRGRAALLVENALLRQQRCAQQVRNT